MEKSKAFSKELLEKFKLACSEEKLITIKGVNSFTTKRMGTAVNLTILWLKRHPIVLGSSSVYWIMIRVKISENKAIYSPCFSDPWQMESRLAPAIVAPTVWAAVLIIKITASGRDILRFKSNATFPAVGWWTRISANWLGVILKNAASSSEQAWETSIAVATLPKNKNQSSNLQTRFQ